MNNEIECFADYWKFVSSIEYEKDEILLFRGQPCNEWSLIPSAFREEKEDFESNVYHEILMEYPEDFIRRSHLSNLAKMQHYFAVSRLLDFSRNALVGLLFASYGENYQGKNGRVFIKKIKRKEILHHNSDRALMLSCLPCMTDKQKKELKEFCLSHKGRITEQNIQTYNAMHSFIHEIRGEYSGFECEIIGDDLLHGYYVSVFKDSERMKKQDGMFYIFGLDNTPLNKTDSGFYIADIKVSCKEKILRELKLIGISIADVYNDRDKKQKELKMIFS